MDWFLCVWRAPLFRGSMMDWPATCAASVSSFKSQGGNSSDEVMSPEEGGNSTEEECGAGAESSGDEGRVAENVDIEYG